MTLPQDIAVLLRDLANDFESGKVVLKNCHQSRGFATLFEREKLVDYAPTGLYEFTLLYCDPAEYQANQALRERTPSYEFAGKFVLIEDETGERRWEGHAGGTEEEAEFGPGELLKLDPKTWPLGTIVSAKIPLVVDPEE